MIQSIILSCVLCLTTNNIESHQSITLDLPSPSVNCNATFSGTILKGESVKVSDVKWERGGIMMRYYIPKYESWFYADSFINYQCYYWSA